MAIPREHNFRGKSDWIIIGPNSKRFLLKQWLDEATKNPQKFYEQHFNTTMDSGAQSWSMFFDSVEHMVAEAWKDQNDKKGGDPHEQNTTRTNR